MRVGRAGMFYYKRDARVERLLAETSRLDPEDVEHARILLSNPDLLVFGPNDINLEMEPLCPT